MAKFKVGDNVNCLAYGKGKIGHIMLDEHYKYGLHDDRPILVSFEGQIDVRQYTIDGRLSPKGNITLTTGRWNVKENIGFASLLAPLEAIAQKQRTQSQVPLVAILRSPPNSNIVIFFFLFYSY